MTMKKKLSYIALALAGVLFASCMGDDYAGARYDETPYGNNALTDGNVISIAALKDKYQSAINTDYRDGKRLRASDRRPEDKGCGDKQR